MLKKLTSYFNIFMEQINSNQQFHLNPDQVIFKDKTIAIVPGSFKPPHKGHWQMVMNYVDKVDKVIVLISNISRAAISNRTLSLANLKDLTKIKKFIEKNDLYQYDDVKQIIEFFDSQIQNLNFQKLKQKFLQLEKICDQNAKNDKAFIQLKSIISIYQGKLNQKLFKSIRKAGDKQITPQTSKQIFEIFRNAYGLNDKVDIEVSESPSPISDTINFANYKCQNCKILLGVSKKGGDDSRWNGIDKSIKNDTVQVIPSPVQVKTMLSATELRNNINNLKKEYFPDKISNQDFEKIKVLLN